MTLPNIHMNSPKKPVDDSVLEEVDEKRVEIHEEFGSILTQAPNNQNILRRSKLPRKAVDIMKRWVEEHEDDPYPSKEEKDAFAERGEITVEQVTTWFTNMRKRRKKKENRDFLV